MNTMIMLKGKCKKQELLQDIPLPQINKYIK